MHQATPPGPKGMPVLGALPRLREDPLGFLVQTAREHGDVVRLGGIGRQTFFLVSHPREIERILRSHHADYVKGANFRLLETLAGQGLFLSERETWRRQRRLVQPAFHAARLAAFTEVMTSAAETLAERWSGPAERGEPVDVEQEMVGLSIAVAVKTLFGADVGDQAAAIHRSVRVAFAWFHARVWSPLVLPPWFPTPANRRFRQAVATLDRIVYGIIDRRRRSRREGDDALSMLLAARDEETGEGMSDRQIRDEVTTLLVAGHESTALTLTWTLYLISRYPMIERRIHRELARVLGDRQPCYSDAGDLVYTTQVIRESMRLYPAFWGFTRTPLADDELGGYRVPAGSVLLLSPWVTHRDPRWWENPEGFDPDRFSARRSGGRPELAYFPFGAGPRRCIGQRMAELETLMVLAVLLRRYSFHLLPGHPVEPRATLSVRPAAGLPMHLRPRPAQAPPVEEGAAVTA